MNKIDLEELNQKRGVLKKAVEEEKKFVSITQALNLSTEALLKHEQSLPFIKITQGRMKLNITLNIPRFSDIKQETKLLFY